MRKFTLLFLSCLIAFPSMALSQGYEHKMDLMVGTNPRLIGNEQIGDINHWGMSLYVDNPNTHSLLYGLEVVDYDNQFDSSAGLTVPDHQFSLGLSYPLGQSFNLKVASHYESFLGDDPFFAYGLYPQYKWDKGYIELGREHDDDGSFIYLMSSTKNGPYQIISGISIEKFQTREGPELVEDQYSRLGGALRYNIGGRWELIGGGNFNPSTSKMTWLGGISHSINFRENGINPGLVAIHRIKPDTRYTLAIISFFGRSLNEYANSAIHEAFFRGGLKRSRIIGGRHMADLALSNRYEQQDFGLISIAFSSLGVEVTDDVQLTQDDLTGYLTYPHSIGPFNRPHIGVTWTKFSDLVFDYRVHQLDDPDQEYWQFKLGAKIKLNEHALRLNLALDDNGGIALKSSLWF